MSARSRRAVLSRGQSISQCSRSSSMAHVIESTVKLTSSCAAGGCTSSYLAATHKQVIPTHCSMARVTQAFDRYLLGDF